MSSHIGDIVGLLLTHYANPHTEILTVRLHGQNDRIYLDQENQLGTSSSQARNGDLDLIRARPYRPAV
jgi:hypothetical protein